MAVLVHLINAMLFCTIIVEDCTGSVIFPKAFKQLRRQSDFHFADSYVPEQADIDSSKLNPKFPFTKNGPRSRLFEKRSRNNKNEDEFQDFVSYNDIDSSDPFPYKFLEGSGGNDAVSQETQDYFNDGINEGYDEYKDTSSEDARGIQDYYDYNYHGIDENSDDYVYTSESPQENENDWRYYSEFSGDCSDENEHSESNSFDNSKEITGEGSDNNGHNSLKSDNENGHTETDYSFHDSTSAIIAHDKNIQNNNDAESRIFSENVDSDKADSEHNLIYVIVGISAGLLVLVIILVVTVMCWRRRRKRLNEKRVYADSKRKHQIEEEHGLISRPIYVPSTRSTDHVVDSANKILQDEEC